MGNRFLLPCNKWETILFHLSVYCVNKGINLDKFIEKTGKQKWYLNKFFISLYSGLIVLFLGKGIDVWIKKSQTQPKLIEEGTVYHLKKLRSIYPLLYIPSNTINMLK